jgi:hypothetical protein
MPLLLPVVLLFAVLAFGVVLWAVGLVGRLRRPPAARRAMPWQLTLRGVMLSVGVGLYALVAWAWRPEAGPAIAGGLLLGGLLGAGSGAFARIERRGGAWFQTPSRPFFVLLAALLIARLAWSGWRALAGGDPGGATLLAGLAATVAGYPLLQAWTLRLRLRRAMRLR